MSNANLARKLFNEDSEDSVFRAAAGEYDTSVCVYPRKNSPGFVFCVWKPDVSKIGTDAIIDGGIAKSQLLPEAAREAVTVLFRNV